MKSSKKFSYIIGYIALLFIEIIAALLICIIKWNECGEKERASFKEANKPLKKGKKHKITGINHSRTRLFDQARNKPHWDDDTLDTFHDRVNSPIYSYLPYNIHHE